MKHLLTALLAGTALLGTAGVASAAQFVQGFNAANVPTDVTNRVIGTYNLFDTSLGTLTSISFTTSFGFTSTINVTAGANGAAGNTYTESAQNFSASNSAISNVLKATVDTAQAAVGGGNTAYIGNATLTPLAYDIVGSRNPFTLTAGQTATFTSSSGGDQGRNIGPDTTQADLNAFSAAGGGTFTVNFSTLTGTTIQVSSGNATDTVTTTANAGFGIYYNYTPATPPSTVPEPASMAILGAGLLGAGLVRRRSRK